MGCDIHMLVQRKTKKGWVSYAEGYDHRNYNVFAVLANVRNGRGFAGVKTSEAFISISEPKGLPKDLRCLKPAEGDGDGDGKGHISAHTVAVPTVKTPGSFRHGKWHQEYYTKYPKEDTGKFWLGDHSHSWLTLAELLTVNPNEVIKIYGVIAKEELEKLNVANFFEKRYDPDVPYCGGVSGRDVVVLDEQEYRAKSATGSFPEGKNIYISTWWNETYGTALGLNFWLFLYQLAQDQARFKCSSKDIRVVFGFDS